ncbi:MAG: hypothetical protein AAGH67_02110 [Cyanobacteria bacterium P01_H01_bin.162]
MSIAWGRGQGGAKLSEALVLPVCPSLASGGIQKISQQERPVTIRASLAKDLDLTDFVAIEHPQNLPQQGLFWVEISLSDR